MSSPYLWLFLTLFCIGVQGFYSMMEMAAVSFNRIRLQYYVSKGVKRAIWLQSLLEKPSRLFGTIMLGVNIALQVGSQSSREVYKALHLNPDWAPLTQVFLVVIFGELAPLFAARRFSLQVVMWGIPFLYATEKVLTPFIWIIRQINRLFYRILGKSEGGLDVFLSRDELKQILKSHEEEDEFNIIVSNIFSLRNKSAYDAMIPLKQVPMLSIQSTIDHLRRLLRRTSLSFVPLYHQKKENIVGIAFARDYLQKTETSTVKEQSHSPWFLPASTKLLSILAQFRQNQQTVAVVLNKSGSAIGILTLDAILVEIFGKQESVEATKKIPVIERTFPGSTKIVDFNRQFGVQLPSHGVDTLAELLTALLEHPPEPGDAVFVDPFEIIAEETTLLGAKTVLIKTLDT